MTITTLSGPRLTSPAVFRENGAGCVELVLVGRVADARGAGIAGAILHVRGLELRVDEAGTFELLLETAIEEDEVLTADVRAPGFITSHVALPLGPHRLQDGTRIVMRDVVLAAAS